MIISTHFFLLHLHTACGGLLIGKGQITSPLHPRSYPIGRKCVWLLEADKINLSVELDIKKLDIPASVNCTEVFNFPYRTILKTSNFNVYLFFRKLSKKLKKKKFFICFSSTHFFSLNCFMAFWQVFSWVCGLMAINVGCEFRDRGSIPSVCQITTDGQVG